MKNGIYAKTCGTNVVTIDDRLMGSVNAEFSEERAYPVDFGGGSSDNFVFGFSGGMYDSGLFLGYQRDWAFAEINNVACCGGVIIFVACPIRVRVGVEG